jgi:hypothetical protein
MAPTSPIGRFVDVVVAAAAVVVLGLLVVTLVLVVLMLSLSPAVSPRLLAHRHPAAIRTTSTPARPMARYPSTLIDVLLPRPAGRVRGGWLAACRWASSKGAMRPACLWRRLAVSQLDQ